MWPTLIPADFCELCKCLRERWNSGEVPRRAGCWGLRNGRNAHMFSVCDTLADGNRLITQWDWFTLPLHQPLRCFPYLWLSVDGWGFPCLVPLSPTDGFQGLILGKCEFSPWLSRSFPAWLSRSVSSSHFSVPICTKRSVMRGKQAQQGQLHTDPQVLRGHIIS